MQSSLIPPPGKPFSSANSAAARTPQKTLGQQDFLKLITVQLAKQDPMKPMEDTAFIAQMAQFTSLEQSKQLVSEFGVLRSTYDFTAASSLLGREVTVSNGAKGEVTGEVTSVETSGTDPMLYIKGNAYPLSAVFRVQPMPVAQPAPAA